MRCPKYALCPCHTPEGQQDSTGSEGCHRVRGAPQGQRGATGRHRLRKERSMARYLVELIKEGAKTSNL